MHAHMRLAALLAATALLAAGTGFATGRYLPRGRAATSTNREFSGVTFVRAAKGCVRVRWHASYTGLAGEAVPLRALAGRAIRSAFSTFEPEPYGDSLIALDDAQSRTLRAFVPLAALRSQSSDLTVVRVDPRPCGS